MSELTEAAQRFITQLRDTAGVFSDAEVNRTRDLLIELIIFSDSASLIAMLDAVHDELFGAFPFWASALSYRLLCLMNPNDHGLHEAAANFLRSYASDYEEVADRLERGEKELGEIQVFARGQLRR